MTRSKALVAVALVLLVMTATRSAGAQARDSVSALSGCFALEFGKWSRPVPNAGLPDTIRLDTARSFVNVQSREWRVLLPAGGAYSAYWLPGSANRVRLVWRREFGLSISATIDGSVLQGVASGSIYENFPLAVTASVKGNRIDCPAFLE